MAEPRTAILHRDGSLNYYENYYDARANSNTNDVIVIYADLTLVPNEPIKLKDKVDIWIYPGVRIFNSSDMPTITDNSVSCDCRIYGSGIIINTNSLSSGINQACNFSNQNSKIEIECDFIENAGTDIFSSCIVSSAEVFKLKCNYVFSKGNGGINLLNNNSEIDLKIKKIETGMENNLNSGSTALVTRGSGFVEIDEILCRNLGHCLSHRGGTITASIKKMTTVNNRSGNISTVHLNQGTNDQKLILYFDEIQNLTGIANSLSAIEIKQGTGIFIGRRIFSDDKDTVIIGKNINSDPPQKLSIRCDEIICSNHLALTINDSVHQTFIQANRIETSFIAVIYSDGSGNFVLKNPTVRNTSSSSDAIGIGVDTNQTLIELNNVKIVAGNSTSGRPINVGNSTQMIIFNYGLFSNAPLNPSLTSLKIGTDLNFLYIQSEDLT